MTKWPDFLFTLAVRFICGVILGAGACVIIFYRGILRAFSHDNTRVPLIVLCVCALVGGLIAVFTTPHWQTPWYKGVSMRDDERL